MLVDKPYDHAVWKRLLDYCSRSTPWTRQLWRLSSLLEIQELLEASKANRMGVLSVEAVKYLKQSLVNRIRRDVGFGNERRRGLLIGHINRDLAPGSHDAHALRLLADEAAESYLQRWADEVRASEPSPEVVSRAIGSHLLDSGFSQTALHKWWSFHGRYAGGSVEMADLIDKAAELVRRPTVLYTVLVPLTSAPPLPDGDTCWLSAPETVDWLSLWFPQRPSIRQAGALLLEFEARDIYSAVERAANEVSRLTARFRVGARQQLAFADGLYVIGATEPVQYEQPPRRVEAHALQRTSAIFDLDLSAELNSVLELLEPLDSGTPAAAVAGSWAAIEALFIGPGDGTNRVVAATRMARIVACGYVRFELISLANALATEGLGELADELRAEPDDLLKARALESALRSGTLPRYGRTRHRLACDRMQTLMRKPDEVLPKVVGQLEDSFRRLYRQRNLVVHAGDLTSIALRGTLRTTAPLVGAGVDRVVHASAVGRVSPLELAALAEVNLARVIDGGRSLMELLG